MRGSMLNLRVMFVHPIEIDTVQYEKLLSKKGGIGNIIGRFDNNKFNTEWLYKFNDLHSDSSSYCCVYEKDEQNKSFDLLKTDLQQERFFVDGELDISEYINTECSTYDLVLDQRLFTFVLVVELHFSLPSNQVSRILSTTTQDGGKDFYNTLRNLLVKENDRSVISKWGTAVRNEVCDRIQAINTTGLQGAAKPLASFRNNSGNITFFVDQSPTNPAVKDLFLDCNEIAERVKGNDSTIIDDECVHYAFFGRFHTIVTNDVKRYYRFAPIQFHIQATWYFVSYYNRVLHKLNNDILASSTKKTLNSKRNVIDEYINKIVLLGMKNETFKLAIEIDNENVYQKIEKKWNLESSLDQAKAYVNFFKDYLERAHARRTAQSNKSQNRILFTISCIQILGLISIWTDYLGLKKLAHFVDKTGISKGSDVDAILHVNTWLPVALFTVLVGLILMVFINRD